MFSSVFSSCKTQSLEVSKVDPLELLDDESSFFITIPYSADPGLMAELLENNVEDLTPEKAEAVAKRVEVVYAGLIRTKTSIDFQLASSVDIPSVAENKIFTKKNGWTQTRLDLQQAQEIPATYSIYTNGSLSAAIPSSNIAVLGRNVPGMVEMYHAKANKTGFTNSKELLPAVKEFLSYSPDDEPCLKFFASKPQSFLTILTGANLTLRLIYVRGRMRPDPDSKKQYLMDLEFEFKDSRTVPAARGALSVAFGLTDSDVVLETPWHLSISNIKIAKTQLYKLLSLYK